MARARTNSKFQRKTIVASFFEKTYAILNDSVINNIVCWSEGGTEFIIKDSLEFCAIVLPKYFKHRNLASFVR